MQAFDPDELDLLLGGTSFIDLEDWRVHTVYGEGISDTHHLVLWFWQILGDLSQLELRKFLMFTTCLGGVPIEGFK